MQHDELEFLISQYADGTLDEADRATVERALQDDAGARVMLQEHQALTRLMRGVPMPVVRWDRLEQTLSGAIDDQLQVRMRRASWLMRPAGLAMAASVMIAFGIAAHFMLTQKSSTPIHPSASHSLVIELSEPDKPQGKVVSEISVSAGGAYAKDSTLAPYADDIDTRPSHVVIASGASAQTSSGLPF